MKKNELEQLVVDFRKKFDEINYKIGTVEDLESKLNSLNQNLQISEDVKSKIDNINNSASELLVAIKTKKEEIDQVKAVIDSAVEVSSGFKESVTEQTKQWDASKEKFDELTKACEDLKITAENQLGLVAMETLANSFATEATNLKKSTSKWFWNIIAATTLLVLAVIGISVWQVLHEGALLRWSFAVRLPIATPIIFYLAFVSRQFSRDKKLLEEYSFKASVARSFEAYRKIIKEEISEEERTKKSSFVVDTIESIYSSPMKNICDNKIGKDENEENVGWFGKILDALQDIKNIIPK